MQRVRERGEVGLRLVVAMALIAALAWAIPMVFFGRQQARYVGDLVGATEAADGGSAEGQAPIDPIGRAADAEGQATLNQAIRVAQVYFAENGTYQRFGQQVAAGFAPNISFTDTAAAEPGVVSIRGVTPTSVVLVTAVEDGGFLCAAADADLISFGRANAQTPGQCSGGWE